MLERTPTPSASISTQISEPLSQHSLYSSQTSEVSISFHNDSTLHINALFLCFGHKLPTVGLQRVVELVDARSIERHVPQRHGALEHPSIFA